MKRSACVDSPVALHAGGSSPWMTLLGEAKCRAQILGWNNTMYTSCTEMFVKLDAKMMIRSWLFNAVDSFFGIHVQIRTDPTHALVLLHVTPMDVQTTDNSSRPMPMLQIIVRCISFMQLIIQPAKPAFLLRLLSDRIWFSTGFWIRENTLHYLSFLGCFEIVFSSYPTQWCVFTLHFRLSQSTDATSDLPRSTMFSGPCC